MDGLPAEHAQSWFLVKAAVAFSPALTLWAADVIGRYLWAYGGLARRLTRAGTHTANLRKLWDRRATHYRDESLVIQAVASVHISSTVLAVIWPRGCGADIYGMGKVSIWAQWSIIVARVMLSPLLVDFMAGVISRSLFRKAWRLGRVAPG